MGARPPRWLKCPRKSSIILDRFVAFKTFLDDKFNSQVPEEDLFQYPLLKSFVASKKREIGLVIDLTNTSRFYNKEVVEKDGVGFVKLGCRGHAEAPDRHQVGMFIRICTGFISKHPEKIIGVHCTHGFNRTGFMIISFMIEVEGWSVEAATVNFAQSRTPGIYKGHYLQELWERYGSGGLDAPPPPELPEWCFDEEEGEDEDDDERRGPSRNGDGEQSPMKKRKKSKPVENPKFADGVTGVEAVSARGMEKLQEIIWDMLQWNRGTFPGCQPVSMDRKNIEYIAQKPYKVSWKADGVRYMMLILKENEVYLFDRDNSVFLASELKFPRRKAPDEHIFDTLLDGELVMDKEGSKTHPRFLIYDIIKFEGQDVGKADLDRRLLCVDKEIIGPRNTAVKAGKLDKTKEPFGIRKKDFYPVEKAQWVLEKLNPSIPHETDGLIFQPAIDPYTAGQSPYILKWKPHELNSVDFQLNIQTVTKVGCLPERIGGLYVQGYDQPFSSIKVNAELRHYDKRIIECTWDEKLSTWKFLRVREDKSFPNAVKTAQSVCESIRHPVTKDMLNDYITRFQYSDGQSRPPPVIPPDKLNAAPKHQSQTSTSTT